MAWNVQGPRGFTGPRGATGPRGLTGPRGATGLRGIAGARGATGPAGPTNAVMRLGPTETVAVNDSGTSIATCRTGETVTGGGYSLTGTGTFTMNVWTDGATTAQGPVDGGTPNGWRVVVDNNDNTVPLPFQAYVMCAA